MNVQNELLGVDQNVAERKSKFSVNHVKNVNIIRAWNSFEDQRINQKQYVKIVSAILFGEEIKKGMVNR